MAHTHTTHGVIAPVLGALRVRPTGRHEVAHSEVLGQLESVAHVGLSPPKHGGVHSNRQSRVTSRESALDELCRNHPVLSTCAPTCSSGRWGWWGWVGWGEDLVVHTNPVSRGHIRTFVLDEMDDKNCLVFFREKKKEEFDVRCL